MTGSKTPGQNNAASDKFQKKQAQAQGLGAPNAPGHTEGHAPGEAPIASDSGATNVGIDSGSTNVPGEKGVFGKPVREEMDSGGNSMK
ncbi:Uu.00g077110.m01.CDS01 [Anthostomella pinea]|uniref:Uu.00g077110.m01.CDS01 n=1 Tax=Anthostomella pinea TaxID=933095 RepID=A0AAI8VQB1_9PEZI|nr:Uu.00g077110.m01.CDS01 [Anthostomella pinea]